MALTYEQVQDFRGRLVKKITELEQLITDEESYMSNAGANHPPFDIELERRILAGFRKAAAAIDHNEPIDPEWLKVHFDVD
jgi:hypothetical protein